jgi:hypothetical protein
MLLPHGTQTLLRVPFTSGTSQNGQSNEEIPIVPYLMVQDPAPYAIDIIQVSLRITYDLKPRNRREEWKLNKTEKCRHCS